MVFPISGTGVNITQDSRLNLLQDDFERLADSKKAVILQSFFKTGKGEYGEGDVFLGISVPLQRKVAQKYQDLTLSEVAELLSSKIHEHRLIALIILVKKYQRGADLEKKKVVDFYLKNTKYVNNWDLVDLSAPKIIGEYFLQSRISQNDVLVTLAMSGDLWERRIAMIATFAFINKGRFDRTLRIAEILINDKHDLIQKAVGWMLREVGKRNRAVEENFLQKHYETMPRTALRYAIERFDNKTRKYYLGV